MILQSPAFVYDGSQFVATDPGNCSVPWSSAIGGGRDVFVDSSTLDHCAALIRRVNPRISAYVSTRLEAYAKDGRGAWVYQRCDNKGMYFGNDSDGIRRDAIWLRGAAHCLDDLAEWTAHELLHSVASRLPPEDVDRLKAHGDRLRAANRLRPIHDQEWLDEPGEAECVAFQRFAVGRAPANGVDPGWRLRRLFRRVLAGEFANHANRAIKRS